MVAARDSGAPLLLVLTRPDGKQKWFGTDPVRARARAQAQRRRLCANC